VSGRIREYGASSGCDQVLTGSTNAGGVRSTCRNPRLLRSSEVVALQAPISAMTSGEMPDSTSSALRWWG